MLVDLGGILGGGSGPLTVVATNDTQRHNQSSTCYSGMKIDTNNIIYANNAGGSWVVHNSNYVVNGVPSDVYVERTIDSETGLGLTFDGIGASRVQVSVDRIIQAVDTTDGGASAGAVVTVAFYDAPAGGNLLDTVVYDLQAVFSTA